MRAGFVALVVLASTSIGQFVPPDPPPGPPGPVPPVPPPVPPPYPPPPVPPPPGPPSSSPCAGHFTASNCRNDIYNDCKWCAASNLCAKYSQFPSKCMCNATTNETTCHETRRDFSFCVWCGSSCQHTAHYCPPCTAYSGNEALCKAAKAPNYFGNCQWCHHAKTCMKSGGFCPMEKKEKRWA